MHKMLKIQVSLCQCAELRSVSHHLNMFSCVFLGRINSLASFSLLIHTVCNTAICLWITLPCVWGVLSFTGCELYNVLNTFLTSLCSQIHVCILDYLSAINIYETIERSAAGFCSYHPNIRIALSCLESFMILSYF